MLPFADKEVISDGMPSTTGPLFLKSPWNQGDLSRFRLNSNSNLLWKFNN